VFVQKAHAQEINQVNSAYVKSQQETSKTKSNLTELKTQKEQLVTEVQTKDARIQQLEQENSELKE
jgi:cell shape-determining protein MreC